MGTSIYSRRNIRLLAGFVVLGSLIMAYVMYKPAAANHTPADKVVAAGSTAMEVGPGTEVTLLSGKLRSAKPSDLMFQLTFECSILTKLATSSTTPNQKADGTIRAWVETDDDAVNDNDANERIVPVASFSNQSQSGSTPPSGSKATDGATFCNRVYERNQAVNSETDYINTKTANAFNWVLLNAQSGIHHIRAVADLIFLENGVASTTCTPDTTADTCASGFVGNRTLIVEPAKLANDATLVQTP